MKPLRYVAGLLGLVFVEELHGNPIPMNLRPKQASDDRPDKAKPTDNTGLFFTESGEAFIVKDDGNYINKKYNLDRQKEVDQYDIDAIQQHNDNCRSYERITEENYRKVKPVWVRCKKYRMAANTPELKGVSGLGTRKLATYYKVLNAAHAQRNGVGEEAPPPAASVA